jgi:hypothetical protein
MGKAPIRYELSVRPLVRAISPQSSEIFQGKLGGRHEMSVGLSRAHFLRFAHGDTYVEIGELKNSGSSWGAD